MNPAEAAVAENADHIAALRAPGQVVHNRLDVRQVGRGLTPGLQVLNQPRGIEPLLLETRDLGNHHRVGVAEGPHQFRLKNVAPGRI